MQDKMRKIGTAGLFKEEIIYSIGKFRLNQNNFATIKNAIKNNYAVGF